MRKLFGRLREETSPSQLQAFHSLASVFILALIAFLVGRLYWGLIMPRMDFYNELWGPVYLLVRGESPYATAVLNPELPAAWLPMAIGFFFPLGWLPEDAALQVWYVLTILAVCAIVYFAQGTKRNLYDTGMTACLCFFFPPILNHINLGQFSIVVVLGWTLAARWWGVDRLRWLVALLAALALTKPHLGTLAMLGLIQYEYARGGFRQAASTLARITAMCLGLCIPLFIAHPNWIPDMLVSMGSNPPWPYPSLYILFGEHLGGWAVPLWIAMVLVVVGVNVRLWQKLPLENALYWSLALAPLVTPYVGSWDFVALFPLLIFTYTNAEWKRRIFIVCAYVAAWFMMAQIQMLEASHNHYFWWIPLWFTGMAALTTNWKPSRATAAAE
jgi:hypothetical protein